MRTTQRADTTLAGADWLAGTFGVCGCLSVKAGVSALGLERERMVVGVRAWVQSWVPTDLDAVLAVSRHESPQHYTA